MKNLETFFELSNYDSKNITNKGTQIISQNDLNEIETKGSDNKRLIFKGSKSLK